MSEQTSDNKPVVGFDRGRGLPEGAEHEEKLRRRGGGGCWRRNERRKRGGGKGKMPTCINCSMAVVVNDDIWISSIAVIHNTNHWEFFKLNSRRCESRPLNFVKGCRSQ